MMSSSYRMISSYRIVIVLLRALVKLAATDSHLSAVSTARQTGLDKKTTTTRKGAQSKETPREENRNPHKPVTD